MKFESQLLFDAEAILSTVQMVLTNLAAPFWGVLADRGP